MSHFASYNPATGEKNWEGEEATPQQVEATLQKARRTFYTWSENPLEIRIQHLKNFAKIVSERKEALTEAISKETGKPLWDSRTEVAGMINKVAISIEAYHSRCPTLKRTHHPVESITRHRPHGVLAVLGPFNFPGHLPNGHIVPALLAGNTVVFKPSELTPLVGEITIRCWRDSGLPEGVLNMLQGGGAVGKILAEHPEIDGLLFTGSWHIGKRLSELMAATPYKILALEMGGNNPFIVSQIKDPHAAAYLTIQSAYLSAGQRCTCARRLIVPYTAIGDRFIEELISMIKTIRVGAYTDDPEPFMGPVITPQAAEHFLQLQQKMEERGGKALIKMHQLKSTTGLISPGLMDVTEISNRQDEEIFGPFLQLIRVKDFSTALSEANQTSYGLAAGLLSDSQEEYFQFYKTIRAGVISWNAQLTGASSAAPFGGIKKSGNNRPSALYAADYCAYPVASNECKTLTLPSKLAPGIEA